MGLISLYSYILGNKAKNRWWAQQDSNLRHADYETDNFSWR